MPHTEQDIYRQLSAQSISLEQAIALLAELKDAHHGPVAEPVQARTAAVPHPRHELETFGLTENQKALWFIKKMDPDNYAYNSPATYWLEERVDLDRLQKCFELLIQRHPSLRACFPLKNNEPVQHIRPTMPLPFLRESYEGLSEPQIKQRLEREMRVSFDLERGPLMRILVLSAPRKKHLLLMTFHHIIFDGTSFAQLVKELAEIYVAETRGRAHSLPPLQHFYSDYVSWHQHLMTSAEGKAHTDYWLAQLGGSLPVLNLPGDFSRPTLQTLSGAVYAAEIPNATITALQKLAHAQKCSLFATMFAAFKVLLYHYTGLKDIIVGTPLAGRPQTRFEEIIGYFVNMVAVRDDLSGNPAFSTFVKNMQGTLIQAMDHGDIHLPTLVNLLNLPQDKSRTPIFQVAFIFQNWVRDLDPSVLGYEQPGGNDHNLTLQPNDWIHETGGFDLTLDIFSEKNKTVAFFKYNPDLYKETRVARMAQHYITLLDSLLATPEKPIYNLNILPEAERHKVIAEFNATYADYGLDSKTVHGLIEQEAARVGDRVAVYGQGRQITYDQLNRKANQLARHLRSLGVAREARVGLCLNRSVDMFVGLLAILKAGGTYLPLDPTLPRQRLGHIIDDAKPIALLTLEAHGELLDGLPLPTIHLDGCEALLAAYAQDNPNYAVLPEQLVYVTFTSGSTGKPKGVMVTHRSLVNAYLGWEEAYRLREVSKAHLQMANFTFDVFSGDMVRALCSGAKLVICPKEHLLEPDQLYRLMTEQGVDSAEFVPAVLRSLIAYLERTGNDLSFMNLLVAGSDGWTVKEYESFLAYCGEQTRLINSYGVTEATIDSSFFERNKLRPRSALFT